MTTASRAPIPTTVYQLVAMARGEGPVIALAIVLALASSLFEAVGLSLLIPLASVVTGGPAATSVPVIGGLLTVLSDVVAPGAAGIMALSVLFFVAGVGVTFANSVVSNAFAMRLAHSLRLRVFETSLNRPVTLIETLPAGKFVNLLVAETWHVSDAVQVLIYLVVEMVAACVLFTFLVLISPFYAMVLIALTGVMAISVHLATRRIKALGADAVAANEAFSAYMWDACSGLRVIRGFGHEAYERDRFTRRSAEIASVFTRLGTLSAIVGPMGRIMTIVIVGVIVALTLLRQDPVTPLVGFLAIAYRLQPRINGLFGGFTRLRGFAASVAEVSDVVSAPPSGPVSGRPFEGLRDGIRLDRVCARYPVGASAVLHDVSLEIRRGEVTAIAGYSGAGKSTIVALLLRFLEPESGAILVDGVPLGEISPDLWHRRIAFVEQNAFLFSASVRDNIAYGDLTAGPERIEAAARTAHAHEFVRQLPDGYDTLIGDGGVRLSQGQRQRIALARSLLREPDVLILDEATNALDRPTERALREVIEGGREARAIVVIAHRRETIENADHVVVVDRGRIVEAGTPAELERAGGVFATLYVNSDVASGDAA